jgi:hypothetical protein
MPEGNERLWNSFYSATSEVSPPAKTRHGCEASKLGAGALAQFYRQFHFFAAAVDG